MSRESIASRWFAGLVLLCVLSGTHHPAGAAAADELIERLGLREAPDPVSKRSDWRSPQRILVFAASAERLAALQEVAPDAELIPVSSRQQADAEYARADVIIGVGRSVVGYCSEALLERAKRVTWIQMGRTGAERCVAAFAATGRQPLLTNMQAIAAPQIAEHAIAMMLSLTRGLHRYGDLQREGRWVRDLGNMQEIGGKTLLVVGLGGIGREMAWRADALGMKVIATRNSSREGPTYVEYVGLANELLTLTERADVIMNAAPLTAATRGLFDAEFFRHMKPSAYFINMGAGPSVVTADLVAALKADELAGAGLDVIDPEPLPEGHPLFSMANVIITPHVAWSSDVRSERVWVLIQENLRRYVAGEPMLSVVDTTRGY